MNIVVSENVVAELTRIADIVGSPGPAEVDATAGDLVYRKFHCLHQIGYGPMILRSMRIVKEESTTGRRQDTFSRKFVE